MSHYEQRKRSLAKAITWRVIGFTISVVAVYIYSKSWKASLCVGLGEHITKSFIFYWHERAWNKSHFGRTKLPEYQI
jgi:uncharacterized membrane protein